MAVNAIGGSGGASAQAAAQAEAQAAAEARRQAEIARERAEAAAKAAAEARKKAEEAAKKAEEAAKALQSKKQQLAKLAPEAKAAATAKLAAQEKAAQAELAHAKQLQAKADGLQQKALSAADAAIRAEKGANTAAQAAGQKIPYANANKVQDVYDASRLSAHAQEQLFGAKDIVSPGELAARDAQQVQTTLEGSLCGPDSAHALTDAVQRLQTLAQKNGKLPGYVDSLIAQSRPVIEAASQGLSNGKDDSTLSALASLAQHASPQSALAIGASVAAALPNAKTQAESFLGNLAKSGTGQHLASAVFMALQGGGKGQAAKSLEAASQKPQHHSWWSSAWSDVTGAVDSGLHFVEGAGKAAWDAINTVSNVAVGAGQKLADQAWNKLTTDPLGAAEDVFKTAQSIENLPMEAGQKLAQFAEHPVSTIRDVVDGLERAAKVVNVDKHVSQLTKVGDSYQLSLGGQGEVLGLGVQGTGILSVTRTATGYTVAADGTLGAGLLTEIGSKEAGTDGMASCMATGGARAEFSFSSAKGAETAMRTLMGPVAGTLSGLVSHDVTLPDPAALKDHLSAIQLSAGASAQIAANLGIQAEGGPGIGASLSGKAQAIARIEFAPGKEPELVLRQLANVNGSISANGEKGKVSASAGAMGQVLVDERFAWPKGLSAMSLVTDLPKALQTLKANAVRTGQITMTLTGTGMASATGSLTGGKHTHTEGGWLQANLILTGKAEDILRSGGLEAALAGDFPEALRKLASAVTVQGNVTPIQQQAQNITVGGGDGVLAASGTLGEQELLKGNPLLVVKPESLASAEAQVQQWLHQQGIHVPIIG